MITKKKYKILDNQVVVKTVRSGDKNAQNINQLVQGNRYIANRAFSNSEDEVVVDINLMIQYFINNVID